MKRVAKTIADFPEFELIEAKLDKVLGSFVANEFFWLNRDQVMQWFGDYGHTLGWHPFEVMWRQSRRLVSEAIGNGKK
jgi:hypothetical protein